MPESRPQPRSIFELVAHQHRELEAGFARLHAAADLPAGRSLGAPPRPTRQAAWGPHPGLRECFPFSQERWDDLVRALHAHLAAERAVLHPRLAAIAGLAAELVALDGAHATLESTLAALRSPTITGGEWLRAVRRLEDALVRHVGLLESTLFPAARRAIPLREAAALGEAFARAGPAHLHEPRS